MSTTLTARPLQPGLAFGVDPCRHERYSLRQARYAEIGLDLAKRGRAALQAGRRLQVLDIGAGQGLTLRHLEVHDGAAGIELSGADLERYDNLYRAEEWKNFWVADLMAGLPPVPSEAFDIVICEQVFEHLPQLELAMSTINRVLKPGGVAICGVPIFPYGVDTLRKMIVPVLDRLNPPPQPRGHVQSFSKHSFIKLFRQHTGLDVEECRGFRIVSGGPLLRPLENMKWWYQLNRRIGQVVPGLCTEIQVVATKPLAKAA